MPLTQPTSKSPHARNKRGPLWGPGPSFIFSFIPLHIQDVTEVFRAAPLPSAEKRFKPSGLCLSLPSQGSPLRKLSNCSEWDAFRGSQLRLPCLQPAVWRSRGPRVQAG